MRKSANWSRCVRRMGQRASLRRTAISAEAFGPWAKQTAPKDSSERARRKDSRTHALLERALRQAAAPLGTYLQDIDDTHFEKIIDGFRQHNVAQGDVIMQQGETVGNQDPGLFVLEEGCLEAWYRRRPGDDEEKLLKRYQRPGDIVGELAVLHQGPRAATVEAAEDGTVWSVSRAVVFEAKRSHQEYKRGVYDKILRSVQLLEPLGKEERSQVIDALRFRRFAKGEHIITQGDEGHEFFILICGEARAEQDGQAGLRYKPGGCFGELALLSSQPRACSVIATTNCETAVLAEEDFRRLLGPLETLRNQHYRRCKPSPREASLQRSRGRPVVSMATESENEFQEKVYSHGVRHPERSGHGGYPYVAGVGRSHSRSRKRTE
eukprot:TRINITY_DN21875_c0_g1_i1.p1 TRINITY_DN21875_c0_g1~~TRINITY_DN21875_c0_g1_i1.p1  ORF type:complete len:380 (+),score=74.32 TRINITY_DN21875_c0_g1_i1:77-1216(+)